MADDKLKPDVDMTAFTDECGQWVDSTALFKQAASGLGVGELCHTDTFSLFDSISAVELMDLKMDTGMEQHNTSTHPKIKCLDDAINLGLPLGGFKDSEIVAICDQILALFVAWLQGNSLAQTVFTCLYLHDPRVIEDARLKAYCNAILKAVEIVKEMVQKVDVYEEEDFQSMLFGFSLLMDVTVDDAIAELSTIHAATKAEDGTSKAVLSRLLYVRDFLSVMECSSTVANSQKTQKLCRSLLQQGDSILKTLNLGTELENIKAFDPFLNSHLLAPTPPREIDLLTPDKAVEILQEEITHLSHACAVGGCSTLDSLNEYFIDFDKSDVGLLVRCKLYLMVFQPDGNIVNRATMETLAEQAVTGFDVVLPPVSVSPIAASTECKELLQHFYAKTAKIYSELFKIYGNNSARRRRKIAKFVSKVQLYCVQAHDTNTALHAVWATHESALPPGTMTVVPFANRFCMLVTLRYLFSGFELQLYAVQEYHMMWWYADYIMGWTHAIESQSFKRQQLFRETVSDPKPTNNKKSKKKALKSKSEAPLMPSSLWQLNEIKRSLTKSLLRAVEAARLQGRLAPWDCSFSSLEIVYKHRLTPLTLVEFPEFVSYQQYKSRTNVEAANIEPVQLFDVSIVNFEQTVRLLNDTLVDTSRFSAGMKTECEHLLKVAKTNLVATKLARAMISRPQSTPIVFDFSIHNCFPIIKYR